MTKAGPKILGHYNNIHSASLCYTLLTFRHKHSGNLVIDSLQQDFDELFPQLRSTDFDVVSR